ncbi:4Fe-4S ferredoxin iron-sulfur binding domain-containing protein (fragment) [Desulfosarcina cetonica]
MRLEQHPTVVAYRHAPKRKKSETVSRDWIKRLACEAGFDDVGVLDIHCEDLADQKPFIVEAFPAAKTLVSLVFRVNTPQIRSTDRSLADGEYVAVEKQSRSMMRTLIREFRRHNIAGITPSEGFPQNMGRWPERMFTVSHKPAAQAAGLGKIGHHRLLIHPEFGSHVCLATLLLDTALDAYDGPLDYNPCINCNLCVASCPTGAIQENGDFNFLSCLAHAYRDRIGGFINWTEALITSTTMEEYRNKRNDGETLAVWQAMTTGGGYRCGYCMAVCPAGIDVIGDYMDNRADYMKTVVKPLKDLSEDVYVFKSSEAEMSLPKRFPNKKAKPV